MKKLSDLILEKIDLRNFELSQSYYYNSLPLCVIDSIYSIGVKYESVKNVVSNFCEYENIQKYRDSKNVLTKIQEQYKVSDFLRKFKSFDFKLLAEDVFRNKQRTSTRNGILKSQAVVEFLGILYEQEIDTFQDLSKLNKNGEKKILAIKGQKSGISLQYFYMLAGSDELIKPDRMILRFLEENIKRKILIEETLEIFKETCKALHDDHSIIITPRELDNAIWNYQRNK